MTILIPTRTWVFLFMTSLMAVISGALAAQTMKLPNSCTPIVTVEKESCFVETIARCGNTMRGIQYRNGTPFLDATFNKDFAYVGYEVFRSDGTKGSFNFVRNSGKSFSLAELLTNGESKADRRFRTKNNRYFKNGRIVTQYTLKNSSQTIGKVRFRKGTVRAAVADGAVSSSTSGELYVSQELGVLFVGAYETVRPDGSKIVYKSKPRAAHVPGDARFLTAVSRYGCK